MLLVVGVLFIGWLFDGQRGIPMKIWGYLLAYLCVLFPRSKSLKCIYHCRNFYTVGECPLGADYSPGECPLGADYPPDDDYPLSPEVSRHIVIRVFSGGGPGGAPPPGRIPPRSPLASSPSNMAPPRGTFYAPARPNRGSSRRSWYDFLQWRPTRRRVGKR